MKLLIGVPQGETPRYHDFYDHLEFLEKPEGTLITRARSQSPAMNRNAIIDKALKVEATHILFIDDDMIFSMDSLNKLIRHDKEVVSGLYLMRQSPHQPVAFDIAMDDGRCSHVMLNKYSKGLVKVTAVGFGFMLIRTSIFSKISSPYVTLGQIDPTGWCDDLAFCKKLRDAEIPIYVDLECPIGHHKDCIIWPNVIDGKWYTTIDTGGIDVVSIPQFPVLQEQLV